MCVTSLSGCRVKKRQITPKDKQAAALFFPFLRELILAEYKLNLRRKVVRVFHISQGEKARSLSFD
jgi:hypothetical protein